MFRDVFTKIVPFVRLSGKGCTAGQAADGSIIWRMHIACWMPKATNKHLTICNTIAFPLQQWWQESLNVTLQVHRVSFSNIN
jgi:hypothetical protein